MAYLVNGFMLISVRTQRLGLHSSHCCATVPSSVRCEVKYSTKLWIMKSPLLETLYEKWGQGPAGLPSWSRDAALGGEAVSEVVREKAGGNEDSCLADAESPDSKLCFV